LFDDVHDDVALHELVRDLASEAVILASDTGITIQLKECQPSQLRGNRQRLRQLLLCLIDNAIKYNRPDGTVELCLTSNHSTASVTVTNTGASLAPETSTRVFERFFRGDIAHNREQEGSGLGLSIARSIVEAHMGEIRYETLSEDLTCLTVELPLIAAK
jgi:signal transduction histidine kinase